MRSVAEQTTVDEKNIHQKAFIAFIMNSSSSVYRTCRLLKANDPTMSMVNFNCACLGSDGASLLADALAHNSHVVVLFLNQNQFSGHSFAWKRLCYSLANHPTLEYLYLSHNDGLGSQGIEILVQAFLEAKKTNGSKNHSLKVLKLAQCGITDHGCRALATWISQPDNALQTLVLEHNEIGVRGLSFIIHAMKTNQHLETLDVQYNPCCTSTNSNKVHRAIHNKTNSNKRVKQNNMDCRCSCPWSQDMVHVIRHHHNTSLKHLYRAATPALVVLPSSSRPSSPSKSSCTNSPNESSPCPCQVQLDMYLQLNAWGRAYFGDPHIPSSSWVHLLTKAANKNQEMDSPTATTTTTTTEHTSLLYQLVRTRPDLVAQGYEDHIGTTRCGGKKHKYPNVCLVEHSLKRLKL